MKKYERYHFKTSSPFFLGDDVIENSLSTKGVADADSQTLQYMKESGKAARGPKKPVHDVFMECPFLFSFDRQLTFTLKSRGEQSLTSRCVLL